MLRKAFNTGLPKSLHRMSSTNCGQKRLQGKVVLITASTKGLGLASVRRVAQEGAKVMICSRKQANLEKALKDLHEEGLTDVKGVACHVSDEKQRINLINKTLEEFGGIDSLVHCAGISPCPGPILKNTSSQSFDKIMDVNVKSSFEMAKLVRPHFNERKGGTIVYLSSTAAFQASALQLGAYAVSKLALLGLTKEIAKEVASENIRVNCIAAGAFKTNYSEVLQNTDAFKSLLDANILMKRMGDPEEMAGAVAFLISEDSSYMTGEVINMSGGYPSRI